MLKTTHWTWTAVVTCAGLVGTGAALALTQPGANPGPPGATTVTAPQPAKEPVPDGKWLEKDLPPSAFPELVVPEPAPNDPKFSEKYWAALEKMCPRLTGAIELKIEPADDMVRKLLKARLQQGIQDYKKGQQAFAIVGLEPSDLVRDCALLMDMLGIVTELWAGQPKELTPWLGELLIAAKYAERSARLRVNAGAIRSRDLNYISRHRLKIETELWKSKNPK